MRNCTRVAKNGVRGRLRTVLRTKTKQRELPRAHGAAGAAAFRGVHDGAERLRKGGGPGAEEHPYGPGGPAEVQGHHVLDGSDTKRAEKNLKKENQGVAAGDIRLVRGR